MADREYNDCPAKRSAMRSFSLVEALLAMTILGIALGGILTTFSSALLVGKLSEEYSLASSMMGTLQSNLRSGMLDPMEINEGAFPEHPGFNWKVTFILTDMENLYQIEFLVHWIRGNADRELRHVTYHYFGIEEEESTAEAG